MKIIANIISSKAFNFDIKHNPFDDDDQKPKLFKEKSNNNNIGINGWVIPRDSNICDND